MKKIVYFVFIVPCCLHLLTDSLFVYASANALVDKKTAMHTHDRKVTLSQHRSYKKHGMSKLQKYNQQPSSSVDENRDMTQALKHLKRRYDRNYTFKYNVNELLELDDFGYTPLRAQQK